MPKNMGLYLTMKGKNIYRTLVTYNGKIELPVTTAAAELIELSELNFSNYAKVVDALEEFSRKIEVEGETPFADVDMEIFRKFLEETYDLVASLEEEMPLQGLLTRTALEDHVGKDDGSALFVYQAKILVIDCLTAIMDFHIALNSILYDLWNKTPLDWEDEYPHIRDFSAVRLYDMGNVSEQRYFFRFLTDYYCFLLMHFVRKDPNVAWCECCGRFFIPKTRKKTLYCDRVIKNGKTCKQIAPRLKWEIQVDSSDVAKEFVRAQQRMYGRYRRMKDVNQKPSEKDLPYSGYYEWRDKAAQARDDCRAEKILLEDALKVINVP